MADLAFSLELSDDHKELQKWLHEFAADVIRPAAHEWDEREETPWPVIKEAAKVGIYSLDFMAQQWFDDSGLGMVIAQEELFWGDAGIGLALMGTGLAAAAVSANGTNEQIGEFVPAMYGTPDDVKLGGCRRSSCSAARRSSTTGSTGLAKACAPADRSRRWRRSSAPGRRSARRRSASRGRRTRSRWTTRRRGCNSAGRSSKTRASRSS